MLGSGRILYSYKSTSFMKEKGNQTCFTTGEKFPIASMMRRDDKMSPSASCKTYGENRKVVEEIMLCNT